MTLIFKLTKQAKCFLSRKGKHFMNPFILLEVFVILINSYELILILLQSCSFISKKMLFTVQKEDILFFILFWDSKIWTRRLQLIKGSTTINESKQPKQLIGPRRKFSNLVSHCNHPLCNCRLQWHILVKQCCIHQVGLLLQCQTSDIFLQLHRFWLQKCVHELKKIFFLKK